MSFRAIRTDFNGVFLCLQCYIAGANHDEEGGCGAGGHPKDTLQDRDEVVGKLINVTFLYAQDVLILLFAPFVIGFFNTLLNAISYLHAGDK